MKLLKVAGESCSVNRRSEDEFLKFGTSTMYIIYFKGGSGIESCGVTWKSEEEFLKLGTSTAMKKILKLGLRQPLLADKKRKLPASKVESCEKNILVFREKMKWIAKICGCGCTFSQTFAWKQFQK
jgi:hypothetical protein